MCSQGELFTDITQSHVDKPYKEKAAAFLMHQIFMALFYCHSKNIVHRDLKPENIMIEKKEKNDFHLIKLIDFGTAKIFEKNKVEKCKRSMIKFLCRQEEIKVEKAGVVRLYASASELEG